MQQQRRAVRRFHLEEWQRSYENLTDTILVAHGPDFFFHYRNIHHDDRVPRASVEEGALWTLTEALLTSDALQGVYLDAAERWMIVIRYPKHAIFHRAILDAGG